MKARLARIERGEPALAASALDRAERLAQEAGDELGGAEAKRVRAERYGEAPSGFPPSGVSLGRPTDSKEARMTYSAVHNLSRHVI